jgi:transposase, IS5 family
VHTQRRHDKNELYALHAPEVECIGKGKARKPYEFGVKTTLVTAQRSRLMLGARTFAGNPFDGHILSAVLEQATNLTQDHQLNITQVVADLGFRGVDANNRGKQILHRGRYKSLTPQQKCWLRRRQAIEPAIGHLKADHCMDRCWLQGALGDALHAISCAGGTTCAGCCAPSPAKGIAPPFLCLPQRQLWATAQPMAHKPVGSVCSSGLIGRRMQQRLIGGCRIDTMALKRILQGRLFSRSA